MFYVVVFLSSVLPNVLSSPCMTKCGIPSKWQSVARNICYGTKGDDFGKFTMNRDCDLYAIRLVHVSGFTSWNNDDVARRSRWGIRSTAPTHISTLLLKDRNLLIPKKLASHKHYYLDGFFVDDDAIIIKQNETLTTGQELEIAFSLDFINESESSSEGTHCVDVDVSCYV